MENISIKGTDLLNSKIETANKLALSYYPKIIRETKYPAFLEIKLKKYHQNSFRNQYSINAIVKGDRKFESNNAGWNLYSVLKRALKKLGLDINKFYKHSRKKYNEQLPYI